MNLRPRNRKSHHNRFIQNQLFGKVFLREWKNKGQSEAALKLFLQTTNIHGWGGPWVAMLFEIGPERAQEEQYMASAQVPRRMMFSAIQRAVESEEDARAAVERAEKLGKDPVWAVRAKEEVQKTVFAALRQRANALYIMEKQRLALIGELRREEAAAKGEKALQMLTQKAAALVWHPAFAAAMGVPRPAMPPEVLARRQVANAKKKQEIAKWRFTSSQVADRQMNIEEALASTSKWPGEWLRRNIKPTLMALEKLDELAGTRWETFIHPRTGKTIKKAVRIRR